MNREYDTEVWTLSIGTTPGYDPDCRDRMPETAFAAAYLNCAEAVYAETGIYLSAAVRRTRMLYRPEWGCPADGEPCYELRGTRNPQFAEKDDYEAALLRLVSLLKEKLGQNAVYLEIQPTRMRYFSGDPED